MSGGGLGEDLTEIVEEHGLLGSGGGSGEGLSIVLEHWLEGSLLGRGEKTRNQQSACDSQNRNRLKHDVSIKFIFN